MTWYILVRLSVAQGGVRRPLSVLEVRLFYGRNPTTPTGVIGEQTPPVASVLLTTCGVANYPITRAWKACTPYFYLLLAYTLLIAYVPEITLFLPHPIFGG